MNHATLLRSVPPEIGTTSARKFMKCYQRLGQVSIFGLAGVLFAGCGQPQISDPTAYGDHGLSASGTHTPRAGSWMKRKTSSKLLYVSDGVEVKVYSFPQGDILGTLTGFERTAGACTDTLGDVFITDAFAGTITEYAHGASTPTATLDDLGRNPNGCSVDPKSGDLAVTNIGNYNTTDVAVYKGAKGAANLYTDPDIYTFYYCTYDSKGNLFVDGSVRLHENDGELVELPKGGTELGKVSVNYGFLPGGGVQWDGTQIAIESPQGKHYSQGPTTLYRVRISGSTGTVTKSILLSTGKSDQNPGVGTQFWIDGSSLVKREYVSRGVGLWKYPAGGKVVSTTKSAPVYGLTVSDSK